YRATRYRKDHYGDLPGTHARPTRPQGLAAYVRPGAVRVYEGCYSSREPLERRVHLPQLVPAVLEALLRWMAAEGEQMGLRLARVSTKDHVQPSAGLG